jgi:hypothetical protein
MMKPQLNYFEIQHIKPPLKQIYTRDKHPSYINPITK